jgi:cobalt-zinc-cadmium efflux system protein
MHHHHHDAEEHNSPEEKTVFYLILSFAINLLLSVVEIIVGILSGSIALIADALHNTSDACSILIAVLAFKIGRKKANAQFTYGYKRAELIGGFVNLILLFISGAYLIYEGVARLITPEPIQGLPIILVSILALIIDAVTAKLSHAHAHTSTNMRMVFLHNLADAFGSIGVILSGLCVLAFTWTFVDGIMAIVIAAYMIYQAVVSFPQVVRILMNAVPANLELEAIRTAIARIDGVHDVHHLHLWNISEHEVSLECHVVGHDFALVPRIQRMLHDEFDIEHATIQLENEPDCCTACPL